MRISFVCGSPMERSGKLFYELVEDWFREVTRSDMSRINRFCAAFPAGDTDTIQDMLNDYLWDSISVRDTAVRRNMKENFYHGMLLGLLRSQDSWLVKSNAETGEGYSDISIQTPERTGIVIELKYDADDGKLETACAEALEQIEEKKYAEGLKRRGHEKDHQVWYCIFTRRNVWWRRCKNNGALAFENEGQRDKE